MNKSVVQFKWVKYEQMYKDYCDGKITEKEWSDFCMEILEDLLWINESVLLRLKHRGEN